MSSPLRSERDADNFRQGTETSRDSSAWEVECLTGHELGDEGASALASAESLGALRRLNLANNELGTEGAMLLADSTALSSLADLDLEGVSMSEVAADALATSSTLPSSSSTIATSRWASRSPDPRVRTTPDTPDMPRRTSWGTGGSQ